MLVILKSLVNGAIRDRISLFYAILFPAALLVGLSIAFPTPAYQQRLLPGLLAMSSFFFAQGTAIELLVQRRSGVFKLLRATPFKTSYFLFSLAVARGSVTLISNIVLLLIAVLGLGISASAGSLLLFLPLLAAILCFTFLGLIIGNLAQHEGQVHAYANLVFLPMLFGTEVFYSLAKAPGWVKAISQAMPLGYLVRAMQSGLQGNATGLLLPLTISLGFTALFLGLAVLTFRWDPDSKLRLRVQ